MIKILKENKFNSGIYNLLHVSKEKRNILIPSKERGGIYFWLMSDFVFPFEDFSNIFTKREVENKIEELKENGEYDDISLYEENFFYYGNIAHKVIVKLNNIFDMSDFHNISQKNIDLLKKNFNIFKDKNEYDIADIFQYEFYDNPNELLINKTLKNLGYDAMAYQDNTLGDHHTSIIVYKTVKIL